MAATTRSRTASCGPLSDRSARSRPDLDQAELRWRRSRSRSAPAGQSDDDVDHVVLAIPFSILRGVNFGKAGFEPLKVTAIKELSMGTNSKLHVEFTDRFWYGAGNNGNTYADTGYQNTWEVTPRPGRRQRKGFSSTTPVARSAPASAPGTPVERASSSWHRSSRSSRGSLVGPLGRKPGDARLLGRVSVDEGLVLLLEGRASTRSSPASRRSGRATATSPASTRRRTPRAT